MKIVLLLSIFLMIIIFIAYNLEVFMYSKKENLDNFHHDFYLRNFNRTLDPIMKKYFLNMNEQAIKNELYLYFKQVKLGEDFLSKKKIVIAGLIRNRADNIPFLKKFYSRIKQACRETKFIIVENNSMDDTRNVLLQWNHSDPSIIILCDNVHDVNKPNCDILGYEHYYVDKTPHIPRIKKLAKLRNLYLEYIRTHDEFKSFDYMMVFDLDLFGELFIDGILHSFYHFMMKKDISAICCNGMLKNLKNDFTYYDSFAYIALGENYEWNDEIDKSNHDLDVQKYITDKYSKNMNLDLVLSAFGGFCIYNLDHILNSKSAYDFSLSNRLCCEHTYFNMNLNKIYVNPKMIFLINDNF